MYPTVWNKQKTFLLGSIVLLVSLIFALLFYKERVIAIDTSYYLFTILKNKGFAVQHQRFVSVLWQWVIVTCAKLGLSLKSVTLIFSTVFILLQFVIFWVINNVLQKPKQALAYILFLTLIASHSFYYIVSELPLGIAFLFMLWAIIEKVYDNKTNSMLYIIIGLVLIVTVVYAHPLLVIPLIFLLLFLMLGQQGVSKLLLISVGAVLLCAILKMFVFTGKYDNSSMGNLKNFVYLFPDYIRTQANKNFARYLLHDYYFLPLLYFISAYFYLKTKHFLKLALMTTSLIVFTVLVNVTYHGGGNQFYFENQYLILCVFVIVPFISDTLPELVKRSSRLAIALPILIVSAFFLRVYNTKSFYSDMLNEKRSILENMQGDKNSRVLILPDQISATSYLDPWSHAYEYWLLSTLEKGYSQATLIETEPSKYDWAEDFSNSFITDFETEPYANYKEPYFKFPNNTPLKRYENTQ